MKIGKTKRWLLGVLCAGSLGMPVVQAQEPAPGIVGKSGWLFYRYELSDTPDEAATDASLGLIQRFNKVLSANGVSMAVVMVPLKMRIYAEHLPDSIKVNDYMRGNYARMSQLLQAAQVSVIDLNTAFLNTPKRNSDTPLFFRLDTHWTQTGAMLAAKTIKAGINTNPKLKAALEATPEESFEIVVGTRKRPSQGRDLVEQLPPNSLTFAPEQIAPVSVIRARPPKEDLLGNRAPLGLTLVGSSYSRDWTGFADALRYVLQRDILAIGIGADQGSWVGMESYLRDDAFQTKAPRMLIWEMPERDMRAPPDFRFRDARYVSNNTEWLLRASAWVQTSCKVSAATATVLPVGLGASVVNAKRDSVSTGPTSDKEFIDIRFDKPIGQLDYLAARVVTDGSKSMILEGSGPGVTTRRFTMDVAGDDAAHAFKTPLPSNGSGFTKLRIFPGKNNSFVIQGLQVCRQPEDILK
ncbi:MAG: hypothetical protein GZ085_08820 [Sulfuriferula multivorans]|uniref:AlgX/AlgJ SGNH hydrolase-like domain-containing protein n=1 Tax=Sulfuriferula multivorans TaxID=1559896 RepID=A0A7C9JXA4_9PROT|nr:hypothetical protein [Sulfuriferula multivorans]